MLEESEGAFDLVALFVKFLVVFPLNDAIALGWNDGLGSYAFHIRDDSVSVVSLIGQQCLKLESLQEGDSLNAIGLLPAGQNESQWVAQRIAHAMSLRAEAPA